MQVKKKEKTQGANHHKYQNTKIKVKSVEIF